MGPHGLGHPARQVLTLRRLLPAAVLPATVLLATVIAAVPLSASAERPGGAAAGNSVTINRIRILGSHNSYRPELTDSDIATLRRWLGERASGVEYGHPPITRQLDLGLRQLEFDPYADHGGGLFAAPYAGDPARHAIMMRPGAKVLHAPVVDARTHCLTLDDCFGQVAAWSRAHRGHDLIVIFVNTKDDPFDQPGMPHIEPFDEAALAAIDSSARRILGRGNLITPDSVRGRHASLRDAVTDGGWPSLGAARGKFLLVLDSGPAVAETYRKSHASLRGRVMFGLYDEAAPEAAVFNIQDPVANEARATDLVKRGFLVRTRSDADTREARLRDHARLEAALRTGAQVISTDYYEGAPDPLKLGFVIGLP